MPYNHTECNSEWCEAMRREAGAALFAAASHIRQYAICSMDSTDRKECKGCDTFGPIDDDRDLPLLLTTGGLLLPPFALGRPVPQLLAVFSIRKKRIRSANGRKGIAEPDAATSAISHALCAVG